MLSQTRTRCHSHGWLDSLAIGMSIICAIHCLVTPILIVFLPILATTFWTHQDFHLWMLLFVVPMSSVAVFMGCRKHKDKAVLLLSVAGLSLLVVVAFYETWAHADAVSAAHCEHCVEAEGADIFTTSTLVNFFAGVVLASAHARNFLLCRKVDCDHED